MPEYRDPRMDDFNDMPRAKNRPRTWPIWLSGVGIVGLLILLFLPATRFGGRAAARRSQCTNNLKQIGLALHNYVGAYNVLPPPFTVDADGKPLHSWRTLILPFMEQKELYDKIDLSKPWDDPANEEAAKATPLAYQCPSAFDLGNRTIYLASVASNGCFRRGSSRPFSEITDGLASTLMVIEVAPEQSVHWMSPKDAVEPMVMSFGPKFKLAHDRGVNALICDGSVRFLPADMPAKERRALISVAGRDN